MKKTNQLTLAVGLIAAISSTGSYAAVVSVSGATVEFSFDDSFLNSLFGSYSVSGDTLSFSPTQFVAKQIGQGSVITNATTPLISVSAKSGYSLTQLNLFEQGDYFRIHESAASKTYVSVGGQFIVDNTPTAIKPSSPLSNVTSYDDLVAGNFEATTWSVSKSVDLVGAVQSATAKVENILLAGVISNSYDQVFIEKKLLNIGAATMAGAIPASVPLPASAWMFGSAMLGFLFNRRRKAKH